MRSSIYSLPTTFLSNFSNLAVLCLCIGGPGDMSRVETYQVFDWKYVNDFCSICIDRKYVRDRRHVSLLDKKCANCLIDELKYSQVR